MSNLFYDAGEPAFDADGKLQQKVMLATTVYDTPSAGYVFSIQKTREYLHRKGVISAYLLLQGNCHVDDARNNVVQHFLLSDCTELVFLDADVSWEPEALLKLCQAPADLVGGVYPYRRDGTKDSMPVLVPDGEKTDENGLIQVGGLPTGFMRIKRHVLEKLSETADHYWNKADRRSKVPILFERTFEDGVRWGGDITFCRKWHNAGGKMYALADLRLGHTGHLTLYDSLSALMRRQGKETIKYMADFLESADFDNLSPEKLHIFTEARQYLGNTWGALEDVLSMCAALAKRADGPIIETGSGLTTIALAASTNQDVYCLEHDPVWAQRLEALIEESGVDNIHVKLCEIKDGFYEIPDDLPSYFAVGLNDGPPRQLGSRMKFFEHFGNTENIIVDDADGDKLGEDLKTWCHTNGRKIDFVERSALIR